MHEHIARPQARDQGLVIEELGDELLVYDRERDVAHCLGSVAAQVWRSCDGERDIAQIGRLVSTPPDERDALVDDALAELQEKGLLVASSVAANGGAKGLSRRQAVGRMAGALVAAPLIVSVVAPTAQAATSCVALNTLCTGTPETAGDCCTDVSASVICSNPQNGNRRCCLPAGVGQCGGTNQCCGSAFCSDGTCTACLGVGVTCDADNNCCNPMVCGGGKCCRPQGASCTAGNAARCCSGSCVSNACT